MTISKDSAAVIVGFSQNTVWSLTWTVLCHWGTATMEMWGPGVSFPAHNMAAWRDAVNQGMRLRSQNHQHASSAAACFPWVCHPRAATTNADPVKHVTPGAVITLTMDVKGNVYQGLGWVGFSRVSMCFCSEFILCICFLYTINNYRTHSSKQTY